MNNLFELVCKAHKIKVSKNQDALREIYYRISFNSYDQGLPPLPAEPIVLKCGEFKITGAIFPGKGSGFYSPFGEDGIEFRADNPRDLVPIQQKLASFRLLSHALRHMLMLELRHEVLCAKDKENELENILGHLAHPSVTKIFAAQKSREIALKRLSKNIRVLRKVFYSRFFTDIFWAKSTEKVQVFNCMPWLAFPKILYGSVNGHWYTGSVGSLVGTSKVTDRDQDNIIVISSILRSAPLKPKSIYETAEEYADEVLEILSAAIHYQRIYLLSRALADYMDKLSLFFKMNPPCADLKKFAALVEKTKKESLKIFDLCKQIDLVTSDMRLDK